MNAVDTALAAVGAGLEDGDAVEAIARTLAAEVKRLHGVENRAQAVREHGDTLSGHAAVDFILGPS